MNLPNRERAFVDPSKLRDYVLNTEHERGGSKAEVLERFGFTPNNYEELESEIRGHLDSEVDRTRSTDYGDRYEIRMNLSTPVGRSLWIRTIWQIDTGTDYPRLITLFPD